MIFPDTVCTVCDARLTRRWSSDGRESIWVDIDGFMSAQTPGEHGPEGTDMRFAHDYLGWLLEQNTIEAMREYSLYKVRAEMGAILPWWHHHVPDREQGRPVFGAWDVMPEDCCGEPMWLVRDGWICRKNSDQVHRARTMVKHPMHVDKDKVTF